MVGGPVFLPDIAARPGTTVRLRISGAGCDDRAAPTRGDFGPQYPVGGNRGITPGPGPGAVLVLRLGEESLLARLTLRSVAALDLQPGMAVFAVLKSVALAQGDFGP